MLRTLAAPSIAALAALSLALPAVAADVEHRESTPTSQRIGRVVAQDCKNLAVTVELNAGQKRRAAAMLPRGFRLTSEPTLLVESSTCRTATVDGVRIGRFSLSESALSIVAPHPITSSVMTERSAENIFMLSQLDTNRRLSGFKAGVGYRSEVTDIEIDLGNPLLPRTATATAGGTLAPSHVESQLTPSLPDGVRIPNPGVVYKLWTRDDRGRDVVTTNSNFSLGNVAVGFGTVHVERGTRLFRLLGGATASGFSFSGSATRFVNDTHRFAR
ncbi:hypothetical protein [Nocardioides sp. R-C-SC26]|uniref:hypothetical protein n=1 Tax=Nocardioides sp. R-C-SC26 TaxID=2870414 RepID=UPI001E2CD61A|nr:hypothetical protein [Nocardioides sp. R-C-SC26]